jgi:hypothetical protein
MEVAKMEQQPEWELLPVSAMEEEAVAVMEVVG